MKKGLVIMIIWGYMIGVSACGSKETYKEEKMESILADKIIESENYEKYAGIWSVDGINHKSIIANGGAELTCTIENGDEFSGSMFTQQSGTERIALIENIFGTIEGEGLYFDFEDDGWGGTGTLHIQFTDDKILVEVLDYQHDEDNPIGYGINNSYEMLRVRERTF